MVELKNIDTEKRNQNSLEIHVLPTEQMVKLINDEDKKVAPAVEKVLPQIAQAVDAIHAAFVKGARLIYIGCGTSGRLGVLDASECPPTFGVESSMVQGLIAGGQIALTSAVEGAEDDKDLGVTDLKNINFCKDDVLVGIAASGRTPYVLGAMEYAKSTGAVVVGVTCCPNSPVHNAADIAISPSPGPEVLTGSTRLKSGTAQKLVLNMLTTASMIKYGKAYKNLMVDVRASNEKLIERAITIVCEVTNVSREKARATLENSDFSAKLAIIMIDCNVDAQKAKEMLAQNKGHLYKVID